MFRSYPRKRSKQAYTAPPPTSPPTLRIEQQAATGNVYAPVPEGHHLREKAAAGRRAARRGIARLQ
eukprot:6611084-Pyramimonas_sp.AAC.1